MDQVSWMARISIGMFLLDESIRKSFSSGCLLIRLWMFKLARMGFGEFVNLLYSSGNS